MFDGLNNNRAHWNELAEVYNAKMKAIEDQKKKLEEDEARKCKKKKKRSVYTGPIDGLIGIISVEKSVSMHLFFFISVCLSSWRREVKDLHHLLSSSGASGSGLMQSG